MSKAYDLVGRVFGRLTVISRSGSNRSYRALWLCSCSCGNKTIVMSSKLIFGRTRSCGCLRQEMLSEMRTTHGLSKTNEYRIWAALIARCTRKSSPDYESYGLRGITVCDEWRHSFPSFLNDMGQRPTPKHSIDRINNELGYFKDNCRWATPVQQARNKRNNVRITCYSETKCIQEWIEDKRCAVGLKNLYRRIRSGWPTQRAIETPPISKSSQ